MSFMTPGLYPAFSFVPRKPAKTAHKGRIMKTGVHAFLAGRIAHSGFWREERGGTSPRSPVHRASVDTSGQLAPCISARNTFAPPSDHRGFHHRGRDAVRLHSSVHRTARSREQLPVSSSAVYALQCAVGFAGVVIQQILHHWHTSLPAALNCTPRFSASAFALLRATVSSSSRS